MTRLISSIVKGNENRFNSEAQCLSTCQHSDAADEIAEPVTPVETKKTSVEGTKKVSSPFKCNIKFHNLWPLMLTVCSSSNWSCCHVTSVDSRRMGERKRLYHPAPTMFDAKAYRALPNVSRKVLLRCWTKRLPFILLWWLQGKSKFTIFN